MDRLTEVSAADAAWKQAQLEAASKYRERNELVRQAHAEGFMPGAIANALGCTLGRVSQILGPKASRRRDRRRGGPGGASTEQD